MHSLSLLETELKKAIDSNDYRKLDRVRDRALSLLLRVVAGESSVDVREVRAALERAFAHGAAKPWFSTARDPNMSVWLLASDAHLATVAEGLLPAEVAPKDITARERVLQVLASANSRMSNSILADRCGVTQETVARILPRLRSEGLVKSRKVGRSVINEITDDGRAEIGPYRLAPEPSSFVMREYRQRSYAVPPNQFGERPGAAQPVKAGLYQNAESTEIGPVRNLKEVELPRNLEHAVVNSELPRTLSFGASRHG